MKGSISIVLIKDQTCLCCRERKCRIFIHVKPTLSWRIWDLHFRYSMLYICSIKYMASVKISEVKPEDVCLMTELLPVCICKCAGWCSLQSIRWGTGPCWKWCCGYHRVDPRPLGFLWAPAERSAPLLASARRVRSLLRGHWKPGEVTELSNSCFTVLFSIYKREYCGATFLFFNLPQQGICETAIDILVYVSSASIHGAWVRQDGGYRSRSCLIYLPFLHFSHHVHPRHLISVGAATNGNTGKRRKRDAFHL